MPTATGGNTIGVKRSVSANRRPGMRPLPQNRNPRTMPRIVAPPTVSTMNDRVRPRSPHDLRRFPDIDEILEANVLRWPGRGDLVTIKADAEQPEQWHDVQDQEKDQNRTKEDRGEKAALIERTSDR